LCPATAILEGTQEETPEEVRAVTPSARAGIQVVSIRAKDRFSRLGCATAGLFFLAIDFYIQSVL
jgi:hypothetical protein